MYIPRHIIIDNLFRINNIGKKIVLESDSPDEDEIAIVLGELKKLRHVALDALLATEEYKYTGENDRRFEDIQNVLKKIITDIDGDLELKNKTDIMKMNLMLLDSYSKSYGVSRVLSKDNYGDDTKSSMYYLFDYDMRSTTLKFTETPANLILEAYKNIEFPKNRPVNIFNVHSGYGKNFGLATRSAHENSVLYSVENTDSIYYESKQYYDRTALGLGRSSRISNAAFDIVYVQPGLDDEIGSMVFSNRLERKHVEDAFKYVRPGGIVMISIPFFRLYGDMRGVISRNLSNLSIYESDEPVFFTSDVPFGNRTSDMIKAFPQNTILIVGEKKARAGQDEDSFEILDEFLKKKKTVIGKKIPISDIGLNIDHFRGFKVDVKELESLLEESTMLSSSIKELNKNKREETIQPLLPFNLGQIGLVLTSGKLDGLVKREEGDCHVIKGRVVKNVVNKVSGLDEDEDEENSRNEPERVYTNKVEISLFNQDGDLIRLT